jgi:predicted acyltransferase
MKEDLQTDAAPARRITSIDALRGLVIFTMIYVNDIAGVDSRIVPAWMRHFQGRSGMTFVDLVFPAFLFVMGMSVPIALNARLGRGEPPWKCFLHIVIRTLSLLFIGIMIVNGSPDSEKMGWSSSLWSALMFLSAIFAFSSLALPGREQASRVSTVALRVLGLAALVILAFAFRGRDGHRIITLSPFSIETKWYGILGLIGWAYLVAALVFLVFRTYRTVLLGCVVLLFVSIPPIRPAR